MKTKPPKLTRYELEVLINHTLSDLSYGAAGTYYKGDEMSFDKREAAAAKRAVEKLREMLAALPRPARRASQ